VTASARFVAATAVVVVGAGLLVSTARAPWARYRTPPQVVRVPGAGAIPVGSSTYRTRGDEIVPSLTLLGFGAGVAALGALLASPRVRRALMVLAGLLGAVGLAVALAHTGIPAPPASLRVDVASRSRGPGLALAIAGAVATLSGSWLALRVAGRAREFRLPQGAPEQ
jgi:hypothetical protein